MNGHRNGAAALAAATALVALHPRVALAHSGNPAVAFLNEPDGVGIVVDDEFAFTWIDSDVPIPTGTATVDFFYSAQRPPTFPAGVVPDTLEENPIVQGLPEKDRTNRYVWDVRDVPSGSYHVWSRVNEPPEEVDAIQIIDFAPGIVTVAHPGDEIYPAVLSTAPTSSFEFANRTYEITYSAFDPDGTGRVTIEASAVTVDGEPGPFITLATDLPAVLDGRWTWVTADVDEGDWMFRLTIEDDRGLSFTTFSRYYLLVSHPIGSLDAGVADAGGGRDAGVLDAAPAPGGGSSSGDGCRCVVGRPPTTAGLALAAIALLFATRRRRPNPFDGREDRSVQPAPPLSTRRDRSFDAQLR